MESSFLNPTIDIIKLKPASVSKECLKYKEIQQILNLAQIPSLSKKEIKDISEMILSGKTTSESLARTSYSFPFIPQILDLIDSMNIDSNNIEIACIYTLYSFISWEILFEKMHSLEYFILVLKSLKIVSKFHSDIISESFCYALKIYFNSYDESLWKDAFSLFQEFLFETPFVPFDYFPMLMKPNCHLLEIVNLFNQILQKTAKVTVVQATNIANELDFLQIDESSISLFSTLCNIHPVSEFASPYVDKICNGLVALSNQHSPYLSISDESTYHLNGDPIIPAGLTIKFPANETFISGISFQKIPLLPSKTVPIVHKSIHSILIKLKSAFRKLKPVSDLFLIRLSKCLDRNEQNYDHLALFIDSCTVLKTPSSTFSSPFFLSPAIWDPTTICFMDNSVSTLELNSLRAATFRQVLFENASVLHGLFDSGLSSSFFFLELILRCIEEKYICHEIFFSSKMLIKCLVNAMISMQHTAFQGNTQFDIVRLAMIKLIDELFINPDTEEAFFSDPTFSTAFASYLFEPAARPFALKTLTRLILEGVAIDEILTSLIPLFPLLESFFPQERAIVIVYELVKTLNQKAHPGYSEITQHIFSILPKLDEKESSLLLLREAIYFIIISFNIDNKQLTNGQIKKLVDKMRLLFDDEEMLSRIIQLISSDNIIHLSFVIKQPNAISMVWALDRQRRNRLLAFYCALCEISQNVKIFRETEFDIDCLSFVEEHPILLDFIKKMNTASPAFVQKFISKLIVPKMSAFSKSLLSAMKLMNALFEEESASIFQNLRLVPNETLKMTKSVDISGGFSFTFWGNIPPLSVDYFPIFVTFYSQNESLLTAYAYCNRYVIGLSEVGKSIAFKTPIESGKVDVTFVFEFQSKLIVHLYVNKERKETMSLTFSNHKIIEPRFSFGGGNMNSSEPATFTKFALFGRPLSSVEVQQIDYYGRNDPLPIVFYSKKVTERKKTFPFVLMNDVQLDVLLPLFAYINELPEEVTDQLFDTFSQSFYLSQECEESFADNLRILRKLLLDVKTPSLHLFEKCYQLSRSFYHKANKHFFFTKILFDMSLWITSPDLIEILKKWQDIILSKQALSCVTFSSLISASICFLDGKTSSDRKSHFSVDRSKAQEEFCLVLQNLSNRIFSGDDYQMILDSVLIVYDDSFALSFIHLLKQLALSSSLSTISVDLCSVGILLRRDSEEIIESVLDLILTLHRTNLIKSPSLEEHVIVILRIMPETVYTYSFLQKIVSFVNNKAPEFLPISCWIACNTDPHYLCQNLNIPNYNSSFQFFSIFPLIMLSKMIIYSPDFLKILISCCITQISSFDNCLSFICQTCEMNIDDMRNLFVSSATEVIKEMKLQNDHSVMSQFIQFAKRALFFQNTPYNSFLMSRMKMNFGATEAFPNPRRTMSYTGTINVRKSGELNELFLIFESAKIESNADPLFRLQFTKKGKWADADLALNVVALLSESDLDFAEEFKLLLIYFLMRDNSQKVAEFINVTQVQNCQPIVNRICLIWPDSPLLQFKSGTDINIFDENLVTFPKDSNFYANLRLFAAQTKKSLRQIARPLPVIAASCSAYLEESKNEECESGQLWSQMWSSMTLDKGPWEAAISEEKHYMRDPTLCFAGCPFKMKRNWNFKTHEQAALAREGRGENEVITWEMESSWKPALLVESQAKQKGGKEHTVVPCKLITLSKVEDAEIALKRKMVIIRLLTRTIEFKIRNITRLIPTTYLHYPRALLIVANDGLSTFLDFPSAEKRNLIVRQIQVPMLSLSEVTDQWVNRKISNFEYLMELNLRSGRTFQTTTQYPVFPWVLETFDRFDLTDQTMYRDLSVPLGAINKERFELLKERLSDFLQCGQNGHLYSSGYSCPLIVYLFLIRQEPFTSLHIEFQSGKFDCALRTFYSMQKLLEGTRNDINDFRELIPEFFAMPEFLINSDHFDLGDTEAKLKGGDVILPSWAENAMDFVYKHRMALESDYVSQNLNKWIDLIWGVNQGEEDNIFAQELYEETWDQSDIDELTRHRIEVCKAYTGQIPHKLFTSPHPVRIDKVDRTAVIKSEALRDRGLIFATLSSGELTYITNDWKLCVNGIDKKTIKYAHTGKVLFQAVGSEIVCSDDENCELLIKRKTIGGKVQCMGGEWPWLATFDGDSVVKIIDLLSDKVKRRTKYYRDRARCCFVSTSFHVLVVGSIDGSLLVQSLERGSNIRIIELEEGYSPVRVVVTPSWGFIVVYATKSDDGKLFVFNINGMFVRSKRIGHNIDKMAAIADRGAGVDYLAFATGRGNVYIGEVYSLEFGEPRLRANNELVMLEQHNGSAVAIASDGMMYTIPL